MKIEIINVQSTTKPTAKGSYQQLDVAYKNLDFQGKVEGRKIMSFTNKEVFATLSKTTNGQVYEITRVKEGEYWQWSAAVLQGDDGGGTNMTQSVSNASKPSASPKSTYETPEERASRQRMIVRQSSISNAIETLKVDKKAVGIDDVLQLAQIYFDWVMGNKTDSSPDMALDIGDMNDDIPM